jgi:hypothetical protein
MTPVARISLKFCAAVMVMPLSVVAAHLIDIHETVEVICSVVFALGLASGFLYMLELRQALLDIEHAAWPIRIVRALIALPHAVAGLVSLCMGLAMIGWVLYNSFVERLQEYSGGFLTFGVSFMLVVFGFALLRGAFSRGLPPGEHPPVS